MILVIELVIDDFFVCKILLVFNYVYLLIEGIWFLLFEFFMDFWWIVKFCVCIFWNKLLFYFNVSYIYKSRGLFVIDSVVKFFEIV